MTTRSFALAVANFLGSSEMPAPKGSSTTDSKTMKWWRKRLKKPSYTSRSTNKKASRAITATKSCCKTSDGSPAANESSTFKNSDGATTSSSSRPILSSREVAE